MRSEADGPEKDDIREELKIILNNTSRGILRNTGCECRTTESTWRLWNKLSA